MKGFSSAQLQQFFEQMATVFSAAGLVVTDKKLAVLGLTELKRQEQLLDSKKHFTPYEIEKHRLLPCTAQTIKNMVKDNRIYTLERFYKGEKLYVRRDAIKRLRNEFAA